MKASRKKSVATDVRAGDVLQAVARAQQQMVATIKRLVEAESPSHNKAALDKCAALLVEEFQRRGAEIKVHKQRQAGDHVEARFAGGSGKPVMLLGHYDTVWDIGTLQLMSFQLHKGRLWGPGVLDMKTGIAQMLFALDALREVAGGLARPVTVLLNSDEEVGSDTSRAITEAVAKECAAVLVCEPAQSLKGMLKTWRKGVGLYHVKVSGKAAHAGVDFEQGQSAVLELARQIAAIEKFTDVKRGITVNVGVIKGGTRSNVVAAKAEAEVDVRIQKAADAAEIEKKFRALKPVNRACRVEVSGGMNRPPMERSAAGAKLFEAARAIAGELRFELKESGTGGGSDGNFTAALGIPTLDGLGAVGEGAHASHESVVIDEIPRRTALLALLLARLPG